MNDEWLIKTMQKEPNKTWTMLDFEGIANLNNYIEKYDDIIRILNKNIKEGSIFSPGPYEYRLNR